MSSPVPARLSIVTLAVRDLDRSTAFYEALGWRRSASSEPTITFFALEGSALALYEREALAADVGRPGANAAPDAGAPGGSSAPGVRSTMALNCASRDEVDAVFAAWVGAGAEPVKRPEAVFWGGYSSYVADPDGHLWEIAHNPFAEIGPDGRLVLAPPADD